MNNTTKTACYSQVHTDGSITNYEEVETYLKTLKPGYRRIYMTLIELYEECVSQKENKLVGLILKSTTKQMAFDMSNKLIAKRLGTTDNWVAKAMVKMRKLYLIKGQNGLHLVNPHMYVPYGVKSEIVAEAQYEWTLSDRFDG